MQQQQQQNGKEPRAFDEMRLQDNSVRTAYRDLTAWLQYTPNEIFLRKRQEADALFRRLGITFAVYSEGGDRERLIPFDIIPRVLALGPEAEILSPASCRKNVAKMIREMAARYEG